MEKQAFISAMQYTVDNHEATSTVSLNEVIEEMMETWNASQDKDGVFFRWDEDDFLDDGRYVSEYDWEDNCLGTCVFIPNE